MVGVIDMLDIVVSAMSHLRSDSAEMIGQHAWDGVRFRDEPIGSVFGLSERNPLVQVPITDSLYDLAAKMATAKAHRAVVMKDDQIVSIVSQTDVVRVLAAHASDLPKSGSAIRDLSLASSGVFHLCCLVLLTLILFFCIVCVSRCMHCIHYSHSSGSVPNY